MSKLEFDPGSVKLVSPELPLEVPFPHLKNGNTTTFLLHRVAVRIEIKMATSGNTQCGKEILGKGNLRHHLINPPPTQR